MKNIWKEKYQELKDSHEKSLKKEKSKELEGFVGTFPDLLKDKNDLTDNLFGSLVELMTAKEEKVELLKKIFSLITDKELSELEKKLASKNDEIKKLTKEVEDSEKKLNDEFERINEENQNFKQELKEITKNPEIVKQLLEAEAEITRLKVLGGHTSYFASKAKKELKKDLFEKIFKEPNNNSKREKIESDIDNLCKGQAEITKNEIQLEIIEKALDIARITQEKREDKKESLKVALNIPFEILNAIKTEKNEENTSFDKKEADYKVIYPSSKNAHNFLQDSDKNKILPEEKLPKRLYDIKKGGEENKEAEKDINRLKEDVKSKEAISNVKNNYATLSYVWGKVENKNELTPFGRKSLTKAIEACHRLGIDYLWIDQLCINQEDRKEKAEEVKKMRKCYGDGAVTLVSINNKLGEKHDFSLPTLLNRVVNSQWFARSWTFQEGLISKQTIFMFDDVLIDGRYVAAAWVLLQPSYTESAKFTDITEFKNSTQEIATPLGRTCYEGEYKDKNEVNLQLHEALRAIKGRKRGLAVDGIYSILGLLPYGDKIVTFYSDEDNHEYTKEEVRKALHEVMKTAAEHGHGEVLGWYGAGDDWLPEIVMERKEGKDKGSTEVSGGINVKYEAKNDSIDDGIEISGSEYVVDGFVENIIKIEDKGFFIDGGTHTGKVLIDLNDNYTKIDLLGTRDVLEKVAKGDLLVIPNKEEWKSDKSFGILMNKKDGNYQRVGLVQLYKKEAERLQNYEKSSSFQAQILQANLLPTNSS